MQYKTKYTQINTKSMHSEMGPVWQKLIQPPGLAIGGYSWMWTNNDSDEWQQWNTIQMHEIILSTFSITWKCATSTHRAEHECSANQTTQETVTNSEQKQDKQIHIPFNALRFDKLLLWCYIFWGVPRLKTPSLAKKRHFLVAKVSSRL